MYGGIFNDYFVTYKEIWNSIPWKFVPNEVVTYYIISIHL